MKVYAFDMGGWEEISVSHMTNDKDYSEEEYYDLCAILYVEEYEKQILKFSKSDEDYSEMYKKCRFLYTNVLERLYDEYGFKPIKIFSTFCVDDDESFDLEETKEDYDKAINNIRKKYKLKIRENKINRINK